MSAKILVTAICLIDMSLSFYACLLCAFALIDIWG